MGNYTCKVDIWSVGIFAFELLTGTTPFGLVSEVERRGSTDKLIRSRIREYGKSVHHVAALEQTRGWCELSEEAQHFMRDVLHPDAACRPSAAEAVAHAWLQKHVAMLNGA